VPVNTTTSAEVPGYLPVAIAGHVYLIDPAGFQRETVPVLRTQADQSGEPGEASLNPKGLWRRSQESYHHGAGQRFLDGTNSDRARYRSSKGIDPWTEGQASLLSQVVLRRASVNTNLVVFSLYGYILAIVDGNEIYLNTDPLDLLTENQSGFETSTAGWVAGANTTIARSTAIFNSGVASLEVTATGAGTKSTSTTTGTGGIPVSPLRGYGITVRWRRSAAGGSGSIWPFIDWYDAAGALISSDGNTVGLNATLASWTSTTLSAIAPANAAYGALRVDWTGQGAGELHYLDDLSFVFQNTGASPTWDPIGIQGGEAAQPITSVTTDGTNIWAALGTSGIHREGAINVPAAPAGGNIGLVGYANGRLLAAGSLTSTTARNVLWEVVSPMSAPALGDGTTGMRFSHPNASFNWTFIAPGRNCIYAGGNSIGGLVDANAEVYRIGLNPTDTSLTAPTFATYLPDGEAIYTLIFYAGGIIMGTSRGIRCATADGQGNIDYGPIIPTPAPVRCLEPQGRYVWFGWTNYDSTSTGLGRLDLGWFNEPLVPAWASDLMATAQGDVSAICTFYPWGAYTPAYFNDSYAYSINPHPDQRFFAVSGVGFFGEDFVRVNSGTLETGTIRYGTTERKTSRSVDFRHHVLDGTVAVENKLDDNIYVALGSNTTQGSAGPAAPISTLNAEGETFELRFTLTKPTGGRIVDALVVTSGSATITSATAAFTAADVGRGIVDTFWFAFPIRIPVGARIASVTNSTTAVMSMVATATGTGDAVISSPYLSPDLVRWTLKALPIPRREETFTLPIIMRTMVVAGTGDGVDSPLDVEAEIEFLKGLEQAGTLVELQIGEETYTVFIDLSQFKGEYWNEDRTQLEGTYTVQCQTVRS
jgi:hypothetical protein